MKIEYREGKSGVGVAAAAVTAITESWGRDVVGVGPVSLSLGSLYLTT
jgi:hypothetical protein